MGTLRHRSRVLAPCGVLLTLVALSVTSVACARSTPPYAGVQLHSLWGGLRGIRRDLDHAKAIDVNVVRVDVGWSSLQQDGPWISKWYLRRLDVFMRGAAARGLKVIATPLQTPCWASSAPESLKQGCRGDWWNRGVAWYPPRNPSRFAWFVHWLTHRYRHVLAAVEIWTEPDQDQQWFWKTNDPAAAYAALLKAAYPAAKSADPHMPVLAGSLAGADVPFLRQLYADGIRGFYDGIALHPYCMPDPPSAHVSPGEDTRWMFAAGLAATRRAQESAGDQAPLWITEVGWATGHAWKEVSEAKQARYTVRALHIAAQLSYVQSVIVYALRDDGNDPSNWLDNLGLLDPRGRPKPAFRAFGYAVGGKSAAAQADVMARSG